MRTAAAEAVTRPKPIELPANPHPDPFVDPISVAVVAETVEHGYPRLTETAVIARAGVTSEEFHRRFVDVDHCALETYERLIAAVERRVSSAYNREADWRRALRAAAYELADLLTEHPNLSRFGMTEVLRMRNELARVRREEVFVYFAQMIEQGRDAAPAARDLPEGASIVAIGSIIQLLTHRLQEGVEIDFHAEVPEAMSNVVRIYLGEDAAREELFLPRPAAVAAPI